MKVLPKIKKGGENSPPFLNQEMIAYRRFRLQATNAKPFVFGLPLLNCPFTLWPKAWAPLLKEMEPKREKSVGAAASFVGPPTMTEN